MKSKEILSALEKEARQNKESGSYLFYGDKRVDLLFYALEFSKMVMTKDIKEEAEKEKIYKRIKNFQHPDIEIINRKNENIKIEIFFQLLLFRSILFLKNHYELNEKNFKKTINMSKYFLKKIENKKDEKF